MADDLVFLAGAPPLTLKKAGQFKIYFLVAFWLEATIYGLYFSLFVVALSIMLKRQALDTHSSRIFLSGVILMFAMITFHNATNVYRLLTAYASYDPSAPHKAIDFLLSFEQWDGYAHPIMMASLTWLGDILVIYRCFLIWHRNYWVTVLPILLLLTSIATTAVSFYWFRHPETIAWPVMNRILKITYPLNLVQNVGTTGLIIYKLWSQYKKTVKSGLDPNRGLGFIAVMRIMVESASIYTVVMLLMTILWYIDHPSVVIVQHVLAPCIGIVFVLIAIRAHVSKGSMSSQAGSHTINAIVPTWLTSRDNGTAEPTSHSARMRFATSTVEAHRLEVLSPQKSSFQEDPDAEVSFRSTDRKAGELHQDMNGK